MRRKEINDFTFKNIPYSKEIPASYAMELRAAVKYGTKEISDKAMKEMVARNKALVKRANSALNRLERAGFTRWAYDRAISYTESEFGMHRFTASPSKLSDVVDLQINIQELSKFLASKSSTVSGNRQIDTAIIDAFRAKGINIPKAQENEFIDLIASDEFQTLKKTYVDSGTIIMDMVKLTNNSDFKVSIADIQAAFAKVVSNTATYDIALEELGYKI